MCYQPKPIIQIGTALNNIPTLTASGRRVYPSDNWRVLNPPSYLESESVQVILRACQPASEPKKRRIVTFGHD
jgi:hypothetical protein